MPGEEPRTPPPTNRGMTRAADRRVADGVVVAGRYPAL